MRHKNILTLKSLFVLFKEAKGQGRAAARTYKKINVTSISFY